MEPFCCVTLNTIIHLGIGILRNATQRKYSKWKHARNISQNDAVNVYLPLSVLISNTFSMLYQFLFRCVTLNTIIPLGIGILRNATQRKYLKWKHARNISQNDAVNVYLPLSVFISNNFSMLYQFLLRCVAQITNINSCCVALRCVAQITISHLLVNDASNGCSSQVMHPGRLWLVYVLTTINCWLIISVSFRGYHVILINIYQSYKHPICFHPFDGVCWSVVALEGAQIKRCTLERHCVI